MHAYGLSEKNIDVILRIEALIGRIAVQAAEFLWAYNSVYFISPSWHVHTVTMPSLSIIHKNRLLQSPQYPECPDPELSHPYGKETEGREGRPVQWRAFYHNQQEHQEAAEVCRRLRALPVFGCQCKSPTCYFATHHLWGCAQSWSWKSIKWENIESGPHKYPNNDDHFSNLEKNRELDLFYAAFRNR